MEKGNGIELKDEQRGKGAVDEEETLIVFDESDVEQGLEECE